ncbi:ABC transporter substrate-binding protein [Desulfotruncus alcoholivorax]|uniref:ABC transporter substrate-binding protein n=1 Tax=Desulfotruncus alcoholivorax TaxID=265477 RepID=UPI000420058A|nr:ABC transporter substrate-binding protein [Desulfotruncus alcoholivorax]
MKIKRIVFILSLILMAYLSTGCGGSKQSSEAPKSESQQPAKEVVIGYTGPLSGPAAQYGQDNFNGVDMAVNDINEAGGIDVNGQKYTFKLEKLDDMADPTQAVNNARRLRDQFKTPAIFNPVFTTIAPIMEINKESGNEFLIMAYTSTPAVDDLNNELTVSIPPPFTAYVRGFSDMAWDQGWRNAAMVITLGAYGDEWRKAFKEYWENKLGGKVTADQPANYYTETDFSSQLTAALSTKPDVLVIGGPSAPTGLVIEQARTLGYKGGFILIDQAKMDYIVDDIFGGKTDLMEGAVGVAAVADIPTQMASTFNKKYNEKYKVHNTWEAVLNYCAMKALAQAMVKAGTVEDVKAIRAAFPKVFPLNGDKNPAEYYGINSTGRMLLPGAVQIIKDGKYSEPTSYVYWPKNEDEFNKLKEIMTTPNPSKYMPLENYINR